MRLNRSASVLGAIALVTSLAACGSGNSSGGSSNAKGTPEITFGTSTTGQTYYLTQVISHYGLDKKNGFKLKIVPLALSAVPSTLAGGKIDVGNLAPSVGVTLNSQGKSPVEELTPLLYSGNSLVVPKDSSVTSLADLKGQKMANFDPSTGAYFFGAVLASVQGMSMSDIKQVAGDAPAQMTELQRGDVKGAVLYEPYTEQLLDTGKYKVAVDFDSELAKEFGAKPIKVGLAAQTSWVKANPTLVKDLQGAVNDALTIIKDKKDKSYFEQVAAADYGIKDKASIDKAWDVNSENYGEPAPWSQQLADAQTQIVKKGISIGALDKPQSDAAFDMWGPMVSFDPTAK
jgi:ABC-type nitrate/sulfonate/bicarbonate transport system substrate-binding protein